MSFSRLLIHLQILEILTFNYKPKTTLELAMIKRSRNKLKKFQKKLKKKKRKRKSLRTNLKKQKKKKMKNYKSNWKSRLKRLMKKSANLMMKKTKSKKMERRSLKKQNSLNQHLKALRKSMNPLKSTLRIMFSTQPNRK